jgi:aspartate kinase
MHDGTLTLDTAYDLPLGPAAAARPRPLVVAKFGGTSVGSPALIRRVARRAMALRAAGLDVVLVVSAMSGETNRLLGLATAVAPYGPRSPREVDVLAAAGEQVSAALTALAIAAEGGRARSFLAHQLPLFTDGAHGDAEVRRLEPGKVLASLAAGEIPVVAGFQGVDTAGDVTTLGRGGSDTTAVAVAVALEASACEIFTDVDGVYDADPRHGASARKFAHIGYEAMHALAAGGAKVLHDKSVRLAAAHGLPVYVRSTFSDDAGTWVGRPPARYPAAAVDWADVDDEQPRGAVHRGAFHRDSQSSHNEPLSEVSPS